MHRCIQFSRFEIGIPSLTKESKQNADYLKNKIFFPKLNKKFNRIATKRERNKLNIFISNLDEVVTLFSTMKEKISYFMFTSIFPRNI